MIPPAYCQVPDCTNEAIVGLGVLDGPPTWVCTVHLDEHLAGVSAVVQAVLEAATRGSN